VSGEQRIRRIQLFVSSPADVMIERERIGIVAARVNEAFSDLVKVEPVLWERKIYGAHGGFQDQIAPAADADLVIAIFWARLGTPLPETFARMETGERYASGTAYEVLTAIEARKKSDRPDVYVFRKVAPPVDDSPEAAAQWKDLNGFFHRWFRAPDGQFLRAFHQFETADEFEVQVERLLRDWIAERVPRDRSLIWPIETKGSPFRALLPFDAKHAAIYFGRDRKVTRAIEQLQSVARAQRSARSAPLNVPFLLIVGESGAGKSSLMRAGLAPRLTAPGVVPAVAQWRTAIVRIGDDPDPFLSLAKSLYVENDEKGGFGRALPELSAAGYRTPEAFCALLAQGGETGARKRAPAARPILNVLARLQAEEMARRKTKRRLRVNLLLLVDQLENIFAQTVTDEQRSAFARLLFALCATRRVWVVATVRSDISPRLITPGDFLALKDAGGVYDLAAPGEAELKEIVYKSAAASGLVYEKDLATGRHLDEQILSDAQGENTLPLLQFALERLFEERREADGEIRLTFAAYNGMHGLDGAINDTAESALRALGKAEIAALPRLLRFLAVPVHDRGTATAGTNELTVNVVPRAVAVRDPATERLVQALIDARIIVSDDAEIGISHQRVFESWTRVREIVAQHREFFRIREDVAGQYRRWVENKRPKELLLAKGVPLAEAQKIVKDYGEELDGNTRNYVAASTRRAQRFTMFMGAAAAVFALLFVASTVLAYMTQQAQRTASANYDAALGTVNDFTSLISRVFQNAVGIQLATVQEGLKTLDKSRQRLAKLGGGGLETSQVIFATVQFQQAKIYQKSKLLPSAFEAAKESLRIRDELTHFSERASAPGKFAAAPAIWRRELSDSLELVGDLYREEKNFNDARRYFQDTLAVRLALARETPDDANLHLAISQLYTRIGDIERDNDFAVALRNYGMTLTIAANGYKRDPGAEDWQRELSWAYNKIGDMETRQGDAAEKRGDGAGLRARYSAALAAFENSLCLRRPLAKAHPENTESQRDVPYTLNRIGKAKVRLGDSPGAELAFFEAFEITKRLWQSISDNALYLEDLVSSYGLLGDYYIAGGKIQWGLAFTQAALERTVKAVMASPTEVNMRRRDNALKKLDAARARLGGQDAEPMSNERAQEAMADAEAHYQRLMGEIVPNADSCRQVVAADVDRISSDTTASTR
jgi:eukaryotic-like serine/threonine-protein kinase